jgi:hypothetical protein
MDEDKEPSFWDRVASRALGTMAGALAASLIAGPVGAIAAVLIAGSIGGDGDGASGS